MGSSLSTREAILYGEKENRGFQDIIESASTSGWHSFDQELIKAYEADLITEETAMLYCTLKNKMSRDLDAIKNRRSAHVEAPSGFKLDLPAAAPARAPGGLVLKF
jgi:twitching motility protein PilT